MEFGEVVKRRRMVRHYQERAIPPEALERVVTRATRAPSAGFAQGVSLTVVTRAERRAEIARLAGEEGYLARGFAPWLSTAPAHVLIATSEAAYHERYAEADKGGSSRAWEVPYWHVDAGASMMLLLLAAVDEGLGAGFLGAHRLGGVAELLGIPHPLVGLVTLGYAAPEQRASGSHARGRRQTVHWERWCDESTR